MPRFLRILRRHGFIVPLCLLAVVLLTWPLAPSMTTALPYATGDGQENAWNIWWAKEALLVRHSTPFWTPLLYQPDGVSLYFHALGLAAAPVAIPLAMLVDPPTALVLTLLALLWLTALTSYLLLWEIVHHRAAALLGALYVALAPTHLYHLHMGQLNLTALFPVPFILFAMLRAQRRRQWRWVAAGALGVVVCALADWQYLVLALMLGSLLLLPAVWHARKDWRRVRDRVAWSLAPLVLGLLALSPLVLAMAVDLRANDGYAERPLWQAARRSVDLVALVMPSPFHPLWGGLSWEAFKDLYPRVNQAGELIEGDPNLVNVSVGSFGLVVVAMAGFAVWRRRTAAWRWVLVLGVCTVLALGPFLNVAGHYSDIPLPYQLLRQLPYMDISRTPAIFLKGILLALAVLLALGARRLMARAGRGWPGRLAFLAVGGLVLLEGIAVPLTIPSRPAVSACYQVLANDPRPGAVLDLPAVDADEPMYYQTIHERPIFGGDLSRDNPYPFLHDMAVVTQVANAERNLPRDIFLDAGLADTILADWGIQWIVFRPIDAGAERASFERTIRRAVGDVAPICQDHLATLWRLETAPAVLNLGEGWHDVEHIGDDQIYRWLGQSGDISVFTPREGIFALKLSAWAHQYDRVVEVWMDGQRQASLVVPERLQGAMAVRLPLTAGHHVLQLRPVAPATAGGPGDSRTLSIAVEELRLTPAT